MKKAKQNILEEIKSTVWVHLAVMCLGFFFLLNSYTTQAGTCQAKYSYTVSGLTVSFHDSSTAKGKITYTWFFGDNKSSTDTNPTHAYAAAGTYYCCLKIYDSANNCLNYGCDTIKVTSSGGPGCHAKFSFNVSGLSVSFHDSSTGTGKLTYYYFFGDNTSSTLQNPTHAYSKAGTYYCCLRINDSANSCYNYFCDSIKVSSVGSSGCHAKFSYNVSGLSVSFHDSSTGTGKLTYIWFFGDNASSTSMNPTHAYSASGTYYCCLRINDSANSCYNYDCDTIKITSSGNAGCHAKYSYTVSGLSVSFHDSSSAQGKINYDWYFGDNGSSTLQNPTHAYAASGTYYACLRINDSANNCYNYDCDTIKITSSGGSGCHAKYSYNVSGLSVSFHDSSSAQGKINYDWYFGDKASSTLQNPTHAYASAGTYYACLRINDSANNCYNYNCDTIKINSTTPLSISGYVIVNKSRNKRIGTVYLIKFNPTDSTLTAISSYHFYYNSYYNTFKFDSLGPGSYRVKAALDSADSFYTSIIPTYHDSALRWSGASVINLTTNNITNAVIYMKKGSNPGGAGFIGGKVTQGANKKGDPMGGIQITLTDSAGTPIGYTYSDSKGDFSFANLGNGTYQVYGEVLGVVAYSGFVTISSSQENVNSVLVVVSSQSVVTTISNTGIMAIPVTGFKTYPNPADSKFNISFFNENNDAMQLRVYDMNGREVFTQLLAGSGAQSVSINTSSYSNGIYIIELRDNVNGNVSRSQCVVSH